MRVSSLAGSNAAACALMEVSCRDMREVTSQMIRMLVIPKNTKMMAALMRNPVAMLSWFHTETPYGVLMVYDPSLPHST